MPVVGVRLSMVCAAAGVAGRMVANRVKVKATAKVRRSLMYFILANNKAGIGLLSIGTLIRSPC